MSQTPGYVTRCVTADEANVKATLAQVAEAEEKASQEESQPDLPVISDKEGESEVKKYLQGLWEDSEDNMRLTKAFENEAFDALLAVTDLSKVKQARLRHASALLVAQVAATVNDVWTRTFVRLEQLEKGSVYEGG